NFRGLYHVLGGRLAPLEGVGPHRLQLGALGQRAELGGGWGAILASNPPLDGHGTQLFASNLRAGAAGTLTRLARGLSTGASMARANGQMRGGGVGGRRVLRRRAPAPPQLWRGFDRTRRRSRGAECGWEWICRRGWPRD